MTYDLVSTSISINNTIHALCPRCKEMKPAHQQAGQFFDSGIDITIGGGYGLYYDPFQPDEDVVLKLCHECSNEVLKFLNLYNDPRFRGGHPTERDADPCCDNCWIPVTNENGQWVGTKYPNGETHYHKS